MSPEFYYYGEVISAAGLEEIAKTLSSCSWRIACRRSNYDASLYLRVEQSDEIYLDMDSGQFGRFVFSGGVHGSLQRTLTLLTDFSQCLAAGRFAHRVEIYDALSSLIQYLHYDWPQEHRDPAG